ncbi:MAG TPA: DNA starvation/stationary phase protection protein Dps [Opitutaceae bacterium]|nr:DNA starvation/stationary phase protection protein Dps [Opitutaceae bacterium]
MKNAAQTPTTTSRPLLWNTHHDQPQSRRVEVIALLNRELADVLDLKLQAKQAHWNVKGAQFAALHELFDEVAAGADEIADELAERAVMLGGVARGTIQSVAAASRLATYPAEALASDEHIRALSGALARVAHSLRNAIAVATTQEDAGTADVLTQASRSVDKLLWQVEAHVALEPRSTEPVKSLT